MKICFISDIHAGNCIRQPNVKKAIELLTNDWHFVLVGDIFDVIALYNNHVSKSSISDSFLLLEKLKQKSKHITYVYGNHDLNIGSSPWASILNYIELKNDEILNLPNEKQVYCFHGHEEDYRFRKKTEKLLIEISDFIYTSACYVDVYFNTSFRFGLDTIKDQSSYIREFQKSLIEYYKLKFSSVVFGHIHSPFIKQVNDFSFMNSGDWLKHNSYILYDTREDQFSLKFFD